MRATFPAVVTFTLLAAGCEGPGNYVLYRIASTEVEASEDCFPSGPDVDEAEDTSTVRVGETIAIFAAPKGVYFLENGAFALEGEKGGGGYTFTGEVVDVDYFGAEGTSTVVNTQTITVAIDGTGARITGTFTVDVAQDCSGPDCVAEQDFTCTNAASFAGTRLEDIDSLETIATQ